MIPPTFDWNNLTDKLLVFVQSTIADFVRDHGSEVVSSIALFPNDMAGEVGIFIDTHDNMIRKAKSKEYMNGKQIKRIIADGDWTKTKGFFDWPPNVISSMNMFCSQFKYTVLPRFYSPELEDYFFSPDLPEDADGYLIAAIWLVFDRLIAANALSTLTLSTPAYLGVGSCESGLFHVMRVLNWPSV